MAALTSLSQFGAKVEGCTLYVSLHMGLPFFDPYCPALFLTSLVIGQQINQSIIQSNESINQSINPFLVA